MAAESGGQGIGEVTRIPQDGRVGELGGAAVKGGIGDALMAIAEAAAG